MVVPVLAGLAGCGGDSREEFVAKADEACRERVDLARQADQGVQTSNALFADAYEEELARLEALEPPGELEDDFQRLLDLYTERTRRQREVAGLDAKIERAGSRGEYGRLIDRLSPIATAANRARVQGNRLAEKLGLEVCGEQLS